MAYYEKEVLKELAVGEEYTSRQLRIFINENDRFLILSNTVQAFDSGNNDTKFKVVDSRELYEHKKSEDRFSYRLPNSKTKVYIVEKIN